MQRFLPPAGHGRVLITSQNAVWPHGQALEVPVLDTEVAAAFLVSRTGDPDEQAATELAGELGGLPLALEQAAAYIQATGTSLAGYLALFRERRAELLARGEPAGYRRTVATTWSLAFARLEESAPAAAGLLRLLACLAPEPVPLRLLLSRRAGLLGSLAPEVAATVLGRCWAMRWRRGMRSPRCAATRWSPRPGTGWCWCTAWSRPSPSTRCPRTRAASGEQAAAALIEAAIPADPELPATWPVCAVLLPHARAVLDLTSGGMRRIADYLGYSGSYPAARDLFQLIADAYSEGDAYGPEHPDTLAARGSLAYWTGEAGDAAGARDQYAALLPVVERVLGPEHPDTLAARGNLAGWTGEAGDAAGARDQFAALLPVRERVSGPEHPDTLTARANLAYWTGRRGMRPGPATSTPRCCRSASGCWAPNTRTPWPSAATSPAGPGRRGMRLGPATSSPRCCPYRAGARSRAPRHPGRPRQPRRLDRAGGGCGRGPRPVRRAAAGPRAGVRPRAPGHPGRPRQPRLLDRGGGGCGRGPRPVRRAAARIERVSGPEHPDTLAVLNYLAYWTKKAKWWRRA